MARIPQPAANFQDRFSSTPEFRGFSPPDRGLAVPGTLDENEAPSGLNAEEVTANPGNAPKPSGFQRAQAEMPAGFEPVTPTNRLIAEPVPEGFEEIEEFSDATPPETEPVAAEQPDIGTRMWKRFIGTDVDDPLEWQRLGTITAGTLGFGLGAAHYTPGPPVLKAIAGLVGGGAGAVAGAVAPEMTLEALESLGIVDPGTRDRIGLSPEQLQTVAEGEALLDIATGGGLSVLRLGGRLGARILTGTGREEMQLAETAARHNIEMMPVQVGGRPIGRGFVSVMGRFPLVGTMLRQRGRVAEKQLETAIRGLSTRVGPLRTFPDISEKIFTDAKNLVESTQKYFSTKYEDLWTRADALGVAIAPRETLNKADEILKRIQAQTPAFIEGEATAGQTLEKVRKFITTEVVPMRSTQPGVTALRRQTFRQMDGLVEKIDQEIASLEPGQRKWAMELLMQLRQSAQADVITNARGANAGLISAEMKTLDTEFSHVMSSVFETSTAKRFESVQRRGLRGLRFSTAEATRQNISSLARNVVKLDSPEAMAELGKLVSPETFQSIAARVIQDAFEDSLSRSADDMVVFNPNVFGKRLGLETAGEIPVAGRRQAVEAMLKESGSPLKVADLDEINRVAQRMSALDLPDVNAFIARRGTMGGLKAILTGVVPGIAIAGGASYGLGPVVGMGLVIGGGKFVSRMLSQPLSARALSRVMDKEVSNVIRRQATIDSLRLTVSEMQREGDIDIAEASKLNWLVNEVTKMYDRQIEWVRP